MPRFWVGGADVRPMGIRNAQSVGIHLETLARSGKWGSVAWRVVFASFPVRHLWAALVVRQNKRVGYAGFCRMIGTDIGQREGLGRRLKHVHESTDTHMQSGSKTKRSPGNTAQLRRS